MAENNSSSSSAIINVIVALMSQVFVGLVLGFCWNNSATELGFNGLSPTAAVSAWLGFLTMYVTLTFIWVNMFKNVRNYVTVTMEEDNRDYSPPDKDSE